MNWNKAEKGGWFVYTVYSLSESGAEEGKSDDATDSCEFNAQQVAFCVCVCC